jgi:transcriptional regulator with XRE-family HTH domain
VTGLSSTGPAEKLMVTSQNRAKNESAGHVIDAVADECRLSAAPGCAGKMASAGQPLATAGGGRETAPAGEVVRLYGLGLTMTEIADLYRVSAWTIASRLDQAGIPRRRAKDRGAVSPLERAVRRYRRQPRRLEELAADLGISAQLIVDRAAQPERRPAGRPRDRADVPAAEVAGLYAAGWTVAQIAARYRIASSTVLRRLDAAGVTRRPKSTPVPFPVAEAARRVREEGVSFAQLARDYQVGVDAVRGQLRALGIQAPPQTGPRVLRDIPADQLTGLYAAGLTMTVIAARHGVSAATISARLRAAGVTPRPGAPRLAASGQAAESAWVQDAATRYRHGATLAEVAAAYAVSTSTVYRKLTAAGVTMRRSGPARTTIPITEAARLYAAGQTLRQLAGRYGVSERIIADRLTEAGTPLRRNTDRKQVDPAMLTRLAQQLVGLDASR